MTVRGEEIGGRMALDQPVSRRQLLHRLALLSGAMTLAAACGPSQPPAAAKPTEAPKPAAPAAAAPAAPAAAPAAPAAPAASPAAAPTAAQAAPAAKPADVKLGGTLNVAQEVDPVTLDPHKSSNFSAVQAFEHVYESLTRYDEKLAVQPALAERWESTP